MVIGSCISFVRRLEFLFQLENALLLSLSLKSYLIGNGIQTTSVHARKCLNCSEFDVIISFVVHPFVLYITSLSLLYLQPARKAWVCLRPSLQPALWWFLLLLLFFIVGLLFSVPWTKIDISVLLEHVNWMNLVFYFHRRDELH